jgi:uncharacterized protein (TIGR02757 family)
MIKPDPLQFLYDFEKTADREIAALISSSLAYGRVTQILKSLSLVFNKLLPSPREYLLNSTNKSIERDFNTFRHRFTGPEEITSFLLSIKNIINEYSTLEQCFKRGISPTRKNDNYISALSFFARELNKLHGSRSYLIPDPRGGSACKRLNLFLRWMIRKDRVDPGCWGGLDTSMLIIPLDTHMNQICRKLKMTSRAGAGMKTALEITEAFKKINPHDPVKYDFSLTRLGIRSDISVEELNIFPA